MKSKKISKKKYSKLYKTIQQYYEINPYNQIGWQNCDLFYC